jgi:Tol biopolymer transport system component
VVSSDGRFVAFRSFAGNLVPGDTNATWDIFVRDPLAGATELVSIATGGAQSNGVSGLFGISISPDGRYVVFESRATNLVPGDTNGAADLFVRDRLNGTTERVSVATGGTQGNSYSYYPSLSDDGRYVAFASVATNLVPGDTNDAWDVFVHDRQSGVTERVSVATGGTQGNAASDPPAISQDGRYVAFASLASNLVSGDTNGFYDVLVHDRLHGTTERVSVAAGGEQGNGFSAWATLSGDGRFVAFTSLASNLVPGDTNGLRDTFVRDRLAGTTERVSVATGGAQAAGSSAGGPAISQDGRYVAFANGASNLVPGDIGYDDVFVRDRWSGTTERVSTSTGGAQGIGNSDVPSISGDGRYVVFRSPARNLVPGDSNGRVDVFLHDRSAAGFTSLCEPSTAGMIACPCSNPPSGPGRGCDNSSATGGALLAASGIAYLSLDSLVFTTSGQKPSAWSLVTQSASLDSAGVAFGFVVL